MNINKTMCLISPAKNFEFNNPTDNQSGLVQNYAGELEVIDSVVVYYDKALKIWTISFKKEGFTNTGMSSYASYKKDAVALAKEFGVRVEVDNRSNRQTKHLKR
tara:strand:+ start:188 stop:499 length:312 start_codon:yes stop_codon:yes gene_type:complete